MGEDVLYDFQEISLNIGYSEDLKHDICLISTQTIAQKRKKVPTASLTLNQDIGHGLKIHFMNFIQLMPTSAQL